MQAGKLRHFITFQAKTAGHDEIGQPLQTWFDVDSRWASILNSNGLQAIRSDAEVSTLQVSIRTRFIAGISAGMRIKHGTDIYDIKAVLPDSDRRAYVDFVCELGANNG